MAELSPRLSAELAQEAYRVQNDAQLKILLMRPELSSSKEEKQLVKATVGTRLINTKDAFAVCARGGKGYEKDLFLIFRGSTTANRGADWFSNARLGVEVSSTGLPVHIGFNHIFASMRPELKQFLDQHKDIHTIHCIGHSLGGAVATLVADWTKSRTGRRVMLYTFGAPKPGFEFFARRLTARLGPTNIHRVYHATDPVPMVPVYPFTHAPCPGYGHHLDSSDALWTAAAHSMEQYIDSVSGAGWQVLSRPPPLSGHDKVIERWLTAEGSLNPFNPRTWDWINAGLEYVLKKVLSGAAAALQSPFVFGFTLADKIAWILHKGIEVTLDAGHWVFHLMRRMMQAVGMKVVETVEQLTRALMRLVLERVLARLGDEARRAIRQIGVE
jgi:pimeloyl-ACP methyl ester carboxylesterase